MEQIAAWLRSVIAALFLAGFLELLLPQNELKGVTRLVMGLLIIALLLQPLSKVVRFPTELLSSLPAITNPAKGNNPSTTQVVERGLIWREHWTAELNQNRQSFYEKKLRNLLGLIDEITVTELKTDFKGDQLKQVRVRLAATKDALQPASKQRIRQQVNDAVELLFNKPVAIEVRWDERD